MARTQILRKILKLTLVVATVYHAQGGSFGRQVARDDVVDLLGGPRWAFNGQSNVGLWQAASLVFDDLDAITLAANRLDAITMTMKDSDTNVWSINCYLTKL